MGPREGRRGWRLTAVVAAAAVLGLLGCGRGQVPAGAPAPTIPVSTTAEVTPSTAAAPSSRAAASSPGVATPVPPPASSSGPCHARGSGPYELPDPSCTPGAVDAAVTPADLNRTICAGGWTDSIRPPESYTEQLKYRQMAAYGDTGPVSTYEEDHLIPLELGGSPTSPRNLWPEPGASPNPKDAVESAANHAVCDGEMGLAAAQQAMATNWVALGVRLGVVSPASSTAPSRPGATGICSIRASYNSEYHDYDIYVRSNQPDQTVKVTASGGSSASWHTDATGYADVYLHFAGSPAGQNVTATVGTASCSATL